MQWVQDPSQSNLCNPNNVGHEASRHSRNKRNEYLKLKLVNLKLTVRTRISETCVGASLTLKRVTSQELVQ
jgi:hypothetical protein